MGCYFFPAPCLNKYNILGTFAHHWFYRAAPVLHTNHRSRSTASFVPVDNLCRLHLALYQQGTNGLVYHEIVVEMPELENGQLDLIPYYSTCLTELGVGDKDYLHLALSNK